MPDLDPSEQLANAILKIFTDHQLRGVPIVLGNQAVVPVALGPELDRQTPVTTLFPPCADVVLSLCQPNAPPEQKDEIDDHFTEYFAFGTASADDAAGRPDLTKSVDSQLVKCASGWPPVNCLSKPCVYLKGKRDGGTRVRRLFAGDLLWLFYFERLGIFRLLGIILDDYATKGTLPISNGSVKPDPDVTDDAAAVVLETMVRLTKTGESPTTRDRESAYFRGIGMTQGLGRQLGLDSQVNQAVYQLTNQFIYRAIQFYTDKRLAVAVRGAAAPAAPASIATLTSISDTIVLLQDALRAFKYGRTSTIALAGIVWVVGAMAVVRALRSTLGIADTLAKPEDYITAAYDKLVSPGEAGTQRTNRYLIYRDCARYGRDLLLDIEMLNPADFGGIGGTLDRWLDTVESKIEGYRSAYRLITGIDLGTTDKGASELQA